MGIRAEHILRYLEHLQTEIAAHRDELTRLDGAIGDADHGTNLERGFDAVATKLPDLATKGRASYLGERSIGHQDPGATSTYLMLKAMLDSHNEQQASG
jgi:dihydroxyacetone kinase